MRVLIVTSGSMGDVAPYTGLGARLAAAGHRVTIGTHEGFAGTVTGTGLGFTPVPGDVRAILPQARGQDGTSSGTGPAALLRLLRIARPLVAGLAAGVTAAVASTRPDAILLSTMVAPLGYQIAEAAGVPAAGAFLQPVYPTGEFGSVLIGGRRFGAAANRASALLMERSARVLYAAPIRDLRATLGLPGERLATTQRRQRHRWPTFHGFSPTVVPRPPDWPSSQVVTGYWWPERPAGWAPPAEVTEFLAAGPPPVFVGFGSMAPGHGDRLAATVLAAVRVAGVRAVVQAGWAGMAVPGGDGVLSVGALPHDWLFPRMAAVVHHCGAGTTAAGLRAGVPAVAVPVLADQPFWARRLHELGVAPEPVPLSRLTPDRLAGALRRAVTDPHLAARAAAVAARVRSEDGAAVVLGWLAGLGRP